MSDTKTISIGTIDEHKASRGIEVLPDATIREDVGNDCCRIIIPGDVVVEAVRTAMNIISREEEKVCSD